MQLLSSTSNSPFVDTWTVNTGCEGWVSTNSGSSDGSSYDCYEKEKLFGDYLGANSVDNASLYSMLSSPPVTVDAEQPQECKHKQQLRTQTSCPPRLDLETEEQQEPHLLPDTFTQNIFNSHSSMFVSSNIPHISSVQSFMNTGISSHGTVAHPEVNLSLVNSKNGISFAQSVHDPSHYKANPKLIPSFSVCSTAEPNSMPSLVPTTSLEAVVYSKRRIYQLRQQQEIETFSSFYGGNVLATMFLNHSYFPLVRGRSSGGYNCKPPKELLIPGTRYVTANLRLENINCEDMCLPEWNENELKDSRRIIRIERRYQYNEIVASFSIVGSALENPQTKPACDPDVKVLEISCLKCLTNNNRIDEKQYLNESVLNEPHHSASRELDGLKYKMARSSIGWKFYVTSVEVIKIIELLVGSSSSSDPQQRRKERGRVRSNLAQFWSKHLVSSSKKR